MQMIDWVALGFNSLWISGLGLVAAAVGFAYHLSGQQNIKFRLALEIRVCRVMIDLGLVFFCLGWVGGVTALWERVIWAILGLLFAFETWQAGKVPSL